MNNIFVVGPEVKGESQIGYKRYLEQFTNILLKTINNISIIGLKRFGKTSLAKEVLARVKEESDKTVLAIFIDLAKQKSFSDFLVAARNGLEDEILGDDSLAETVYQNKLFNRYHDKINSVDPESKTYRDTLETLFKCITRLGIRVILAIDEFDAASELFTETADFEFLRDLSSNRDVGVSLVLVSRRQLYMIEKKNFNNSTFHGVVQTYPIDGFDQEDMKEFFEVLSSRYGIELIEYSAERLHYYCGRSPYLHSMFAYDIVEDHAAGKEINIDAIYRRREIDIENYYKSIFACLQNDRIEVPGAYEEVSTIEKLVGVIVGPKINIVESDISVLKTMGYLYLEGETYYSISEHFTNALRRAPLQIDIWSALLGAEKKLKTMVRKQVMLNNNVEYIDYDLWADIFAEAGDGATLDTYDKFVNNSMSDYDANVDVLDVCGLDIVVDIIQIYWEAWFSKFFENDAWSQWENKLRLCAKARNPLAHGHEDFLSAEEKASVNEYCESILKLLSKSNACTDIETEVKLEVNKKKLEVRRKYYSLPRDIVGNELKDRTCVMTAAEQTNKMIKGFISLDGKNYICSVKKEKWEQKYPDTPLSSHLGKEFNVWIESVNIPQNTLQIQLL
jgi:hypothetical protein